MERRYVPEDELEVLPVDGAAPASAAPAPAPGATRWAGSGGRAPRYRAAVLATIVVFVASVSSLLIVPGHETGTQALESVRQWVKDHRTVRFTDLMSSTMGVDVDAHGNTPLGHTFTDRSRATGEVHLPEQAHIVTEDGESAEEQLMLGEVRWSRSADSVKELDGEQWSRFRMSMLGGDVGRGWFGYEPSRTIVSSDSGGMRMTPDGASMFSQVMDQVGSGLVDFVDVPLRLDSLLAHLNHVDRVADGVLRGTVPLVDMLPEPLRRLMPAVSPLHGEFTVELRYGPSGRLDGLVLDATVSFDDTRTSEHHDISFSDWGLPVTVVPPAESAIDTTPGIDEPGLAQLGGSVTVLAPSPVVGGWVLESLEVEQRDEDSEDCEAVTLEYGPRSHVMGRDEDEPPSVSITSVPTSCPWLNNIVPELVGARAVKVGAWTAQVVDNVDDNTYSYLDSGMTAALTVNGTYVVASTNAGQDILTRMLSTLAPLNLQTQPIIRIAG